MHDVARGMVCLESGVGNKLLSIFIGLCSSVGLSISSEDIHSCTQCKRGKYRIFFVTVEAYICMKT